MPRKSKKPVRKQTQSPTGEVVGQVGQILLPMIAGIAATKADLTEWVYEQGLTALHLLLKEDAEEIAGPKGKHEKGRTHNHWGSTNGELSFGGRRIQVSRPRVRSKSGEEASLPHFEAFPRRRPASRASVESDLGGGIDPKLRIESGQTRGQVEVSWHEQECRQPSPREPDDAEARGIPVSAAGVV